MTIRLGYRIAALATVLLLAILGNLVARIYDRQEILVDTQHRRLKSVWAAGELKTSPEGATRLLKGPMPPSAA